MLTNFWRYSHLLLAVGSSVFLLIATVTGLILSTEPVADHFNAPSDRVAADTTSLAQLIPQLKEEYIEVFSLSVDIEKTVKIDAMGWDEETDGSFYIHPSTGKKIADIPLKNKVYTWTTTLHRSLFMHATGRIIMGVTVFLLFLMTLTGMALVIRHTNGIQHIFKRIKKQNSTQYYHTFFGRLTFIPIAIMAFAGTVLFLNTQLESKAHPEVQNTLTQKEPIDLDDFPIFKTTHLTDIKALHFPFSEEEEDYYELELHNRNLKIHQFTGEVITEQPATWIQNLTALSMTLHTGKGQWIWAVVLGLIAVNLLYFIYSGTKITWKRIASKTRNKVNPEEATFIILIGSENGSTKRFANLLAHALLKSGHSVFTSDLNHYQTYPKAKHLVIMTSTYGDGTAPFNARNFLSKVTETNQPNTLNTHVIGFGSMIYPKFCQYAIQVYETLQSTSHFQLNALPTLIDGQSYRSFALSIEDWKKRHAIELEIPSEDKRKAIALSNYKVVQKQIVDDGHVLTFTLELSPQEKTKFQSGDLLAIAPPEDNLVRYYSIGKTEEGNILLSIKKHTYGKCSAYLFEQEIGDEILAYIKENSKFHLPKKGNVLMIANGTGIAPFLGMNSVYSNQKKTFFLGGRNTLSFTLYHKIIQQNKTETLRPPLHFALSKEKGTHRYVQDLVIEHKAEVVLLLKNKGSIMICGSVKMRDGVLGTLKSILEEEGLPPLEKYIEKHKILMDCY